MTTKPNENSQKPDKPTITSRPHTKTLISGVVNKGNLFEVGDHVTDANEEFNYTIIHVYLIYKTQEGRVQGFILQNHPLAKSDDWIFSGMYGISKAPGEYIDVHQEELTLVAKAGEPFNVGFLPH